MVKHWLIRSEVTAFGWNDHEGGIIHSKRMLSPCVTGTDLEQAVTERDITSPGKSGQLVDHNNKVRIIRTVPG